MPDTQEPRVRRSPEREREPIEPTNDGKRILLDFFRYLRSPAALAQSLNKSRTLEGQIYAYFYSRPGIGYEKLNKYDALQWCLGYDAQIKRFHAEIKELEKQYPDLIQDVLTYDWQYTRINKGFEREEDAGRIYINVDPNRAPEIYRKIAFAYFSRCMNRDCGGIEMKIEKDGHSHSYDRVDKIIIYFNGASEEDILAVLDQVHDEEAGAFLEAIPRFTAQLYKPDGRVMKGVSVGDHPRKGPGEKKRKSFGEIRSFILEDLIKEGVWISEAEDPWEIERAYEVFKRVCMKYGVDPENPAFNEYDDPEKFFPEIRKRLRRRILPTN